MKKLGPDFVGSFYFKQTPSGNLIGEFINNYSSSINVESAKLKRFLENFVGDFTSVWDDGVLHKAKLKITKKYDKYIVEWTDPGHYNYEGEAIVVDNILMGYYRVKP